MLSKKYAYRFEILGVLFALVFLVLMSRAAWLQIYEGDYYKGQADGNRIRLTPIMAPRGLFYDRNGVPLVTNRPSFTVVVNAKENRFTPEIAGKLADILGLPVDEISNKVEKNKNNYEPVVIKSDLTPEIVTRLEERRGDLPGVMIVIRPLRIYNCNELAAHTLGYVGEISEEELAQLKDKGYKQGQIIGKLGLEKYYDGILRGEDGATRVEVDVAGRVVHQLGKKEAMPGESLYLTLDADIQKSAERAVSEHLAWLRYNGNYKAQAAAVVVMDPRNGAVLALVSWPTFNPNSFVSGISQKEWDKISKNPYNPMSNKAISGEYPPGSAFKVVTGAAALELGKVTAGEAIFDGGFHRLVPDKGNAGGGALGWIAFNEALAKSDNVYFYEMAYRLGIANLEKYARAFGYGSLTGINLPGESEGLVANPEYKRKLFNEDWYLAETFDAGIGQGFQLATPLQMAMAISAVANGGTRYKPYLVSKIVSDKNELIQTFEPQVAGTLPVSQYNIELIKKGLRDVAQEGGTAGQLAGFTVPLAGKTGTSENSMGQDHGVFVAYAPADKPEIAIAVLVEQGGYGSKAAVPIARRIFEDYFHVKP